MFPALLDEPLYFEVLQEVSHPNRKGYKTVVRLNAGGPVRKIVPGDFDLYGRVVCWALQGKVKFVERKPMRATMSGSVKVGG